MSDIDQLIIGGQISSAILLIVIQSLFIVHLLHKRNVSDKQRG